MLAVIAFDSFKGCLSSAEANQAAAEALAQVPDCHVLSVPLSDGGEGWLDTFLSAGGGELVEVDVCDPLRRNIRAQYLRQGDLAIVESARACGLHLMNPEERDLLKADTYGLGLLLRQVVESGSKTIYLGLGGSGTSDAGRGLIEALPCLPEGVEMVVATDVRNPLCGPDGAAAVFGPQKGAHQKTVLVLDLLARLFAERSAKLLGKDCSSLPGAGAAGGLGYACMQYYDARCCSGADLLLDTVGFDHLLQDANLVITGEGSADRQTLMGKLPERILTRAKAANVPVWLLAGRIKDADRLLDAGFSRVVSITPADMPLAEALLPTIACSNLQAALLDLLKKI